MYSVYVLYMNEIPFYAGLSTRPEIRFREHYSDFACPCANYLRHMANEYNKFMRMKIVFKCDDEIEARNTERKCINYLVLAGFLIFNRTEVIGNYPVLPKYPIVKRLKTPILYKKSIIKMISYE